MNLSQHKETKRKCPQCKLQKTFPSRNETCSSECAYALRSLRAGTDGSTFEQTVAALLTKAHGRVNLSELSEKLDRSTATVRIALETLRGQGFNVEIAADAASLTNIIRPGSAEPIVHKVEHFDGNWHKFGACGDNHLGSKHERLDVLNALYDLYEAEGITTVYNTGNWIEGEMRLNHHDISVFGLDGQIEYACEMFPQRKGITTYFVAGDDHEGWYQRNNRMEIGRYFQSMAAKGGRHDLKYMGFVEADVKLVAPNGHAMMKVMHPGGGSAYAHSYAPQKLVESFQGGEKPSVMLIGHYHKFEYCYPREVHVVQTGCTVDQSIFMRKQKIQAMVGGTIIRINQTPDGKINRFAVEWIPFYDRGFYSPSQRQFGLIQGGKEPRPVLEVKSRRKVA